MKKSTIISIVGAAIAVIAIVVLAITSLTAHAKLEAAQDELKSTKIELSDTRDNLSYVSQQVATCKEAVEYGGHIIESLTIVFDLTTNQYQNLFTATEHDVMAYSLQMETQAAMMEKNVDPYMTARDNCIG